MKEIKNKGIEPTETLAELFISQKQYLQSLAIYLYLINEDGQERLKPKLDEIMRDIIQSDPKYKSQLNMIFSEEDLIRFKILPEPKFKKFLEDFKEIFEHEKFPEEIEVEDSASEDIEDMSKQKTVEKNSGEPNEDLFKKTKKSKLLEFDSYGLNKYTIKDFIEIIAENIDQDLRIDQLKIKDIMKIIKSLNFKYEKK